MEHSNIVKNEEFKLDKIFKRFGKNNLKIFYFANPAEKYDKHLCYICGYYSYYSYLFCNSCIKKCCIDHEKPCKCI